MSDKHLDTFRKLFLTLPIITLLAACGGGGGGSDSNPAAPDPSIEPVTFTGSLVDEGSAPAADVTVEVPTQVKVHSATTNSSGQYSLQVPGSELENVKDVTISGKKTGYRSWFDSYPEVMPGKTYTSNGIMEKLGEFEAPADPESFLGSILHLGDGDFGGAANSQLLQAEPQGGFGSYTFSFTQAQLDASYDTIRVRFFSRGVQSDVWESQVILTEAADPAPGADDLGQLHEMSNVDGSWTEQIYYFAAGDYSAGAKNFRLTFTSPEASGYRQIDDFEITDVRIDLLDL